MTDTDKEMEKLEAMAAKAKKEIAQTVKALVQATDSKVYRTQDTVSSDSLLEGLGEMNQPVVIDGVEVLPPGDKSAALAEIQKAEEKDRQRRMLYEKDKTFFEQNVMKQARSLCEIQEDYIKVLHPTYREKFIAGIARYGTVAAAMKYMKDNHGLKLRGDVLTRIAQMVPSFKQEIEDAKEEYQATLQMEMHRRAVEGVDKGVYYNGEQVATEKVYSDSLLVKMVDTHNPEYKEAKQKESKWGNQINVQIIKDFHNYKE